MYELLRVIESDSPKSRSVTIIVTCIGFADNFE